MNLRLRGPKFEEKRDSPRVELDCPCRVCPIKKRFLMSHRGKTSEGMIKRPSLFGLSLLHEDTFPEGTILEIEVLLDTKGYEENCVIAGTVIWSKPQMPENRMLHGVRLQETHADLTAWQKVIREILTSTD